MMVAGLGVVVLLVNSSTLLAPMVLFGSVLSPSTNVN